MFPRDQRLPGTSRARKRNNKTRPWGKTDGHSFGGRWLREKQTPRTQRSTMEIRAAMSRGFSGRDSWNVTRHLRSCIPKMPSQRSCSPPPQKKKQEERQATASRFLPPKTKRKKQKRQKDRKVTSSHPLPPHNKTKGRYKPFQRDSPMNDAPISLRFLAKTEVLRAQHQLQLVKGHAGSAAHASPLLLSKGMGQHRGVPNGTGSLEWSQAPNWVYTFKTNTQITVLVILLFLSTSQQKTPSACGWVSVLRAPFWACCKA